MTPPLTQPAQALLLGVEHPELGDVASAALAHDLGIALSRGRHPKAYRHTDPNEDVVAVLRHGRSTALVVADGHSGAEGSHTAVAALLELLVGQAGAELPMWSRRDAVLAFHAVGERIGAVRAGLGPRSRGARTTLLLAVAADTPGGGRSVVHASVGDSAVLAVSTRGVRPLSRDRHHFLGERLSPPQVAGAMDHAVSDLAADEALVAVSDGFTNFAHPSALVDVLAGAPAADAEALARRVVEEAGEAGAGDNVAVAVLLPAAGAGPAAVPRGA
jgi:serine/threonine protein phosphatase PrpC